MGEKIDAGLVRHIGLLSRIELSDTEVSRFAATLANIVEYFDKLNELDTQDVEPMAHAVELNNVLADDNPGQSLSADEALANAPARDGDFFMVPKVLADS